MRRQLTGAVLLLALALSGCGGSDDDSGADGVATAGGTAGADPSVAASADVPDADRQLKFAQCMRENGVEMPDPEPGGRPNLRFGPDTDPGKVEAAMQKCRTFLPNGGQRLRLDPEQVERMRAMAACMRQNGVPDFPDPDADGRIRMDRAVVDRDDPKVRAAFEKCREFAPGFGGDR